ncbi:hypothetical protein DIPPA_05527 [Diplonema papillatum]|nr:hypothetical protein DIPPA_05527 [Diplonema papillatum]
MWDLPERRRVLRTGASQGWRPGRRGQQWRRRWRRPRHWSRPRTRRRSRQRPGRRSRRRRWRSQPRRERRPHRPEAARAVPARDTYQPWPEEADDEVAPEARPPASRQEATRAMHPHGLSRSRATRTTTTTRRSRRRRHWPRRPEHTAPTRPRPALFDGRP